MQVYNIIAYIVVLPEPYEKKVSNTVMIVLCAFATLVGYYLTK